MSRVTSTVVAAWLLLAPWLSAQTKVNPGFNIFSVQQDIEIGEQSAREVERELPVLRQPWAHRYVSQIGKRLALGAPGADYPYQFKVLNVSDINAFALPGGFIYINRGLIEAARSEAELAGVVAHEIGHVALRHGTNRVSKAYLAEAGLGILGGLLGDKRSTGEIVRLAGGFGLNALFLKYSRQAERQADIVGAQMLAKAGYNPTAMSSFFDLMAEKAGREPGKVEKFFSSHPAPTDRAERIEEEMRLIGRFRESPSEGDLSDIHRRLKKLPEAPSMEELARRASGPSGSGPHDDEAAPVEAPSYRMKTFTQRQGAFRIRFPDNWRALPHKNEFGVTLAPQRGLIELENGSRNITHGVIIDSYRVGGRAWEERSLERATRRLVEQLLQNNPYLNWEQRAGREEYIDGEPCMVQVLSGPSPVTGQTERVTLLTRWLAKGDLIYLLLVAPLRDYPDWTETFQRMVSSLSIGEGW